MTPEVRRVATTVKLLDGRPVTPERRIREVETVACARAIASDPDIRAARTELKVEGARFGGNVVGNIACHEELAQGNRQCWKIARCTGDLFRVW